VTHPNDQTNDQCECFPGGWVGSEWQEPDNLDGLAGWWTEVRAGDDPEQPYKLRMDLPPRPEFDWLTAYLCDALGWTEHGGGVGGAWLTDEGERALSNLRAALTDPGEDQTKP
jgi:hypothetical protein